MDDKTISLIHKALSGTISAEERELLQTWKTASDENLLLFSQYEIIWQAVSLPAIGIDALLISGEKEKILARIKKGDGR